MSQNQQEERNPSDKLSTFFSVINTVYNMTPKSKRASIDQVLGIAGETCKSILLKIQNTFETGKISYLPIEAILNGIYLSLPPEGRTFLMDLFRTKMGQTVANATKIIDGVVKGDNSKQQVEQFLAGIGLVSDELSIKFQKIILLETGYMPVTVFFPIQRDMNDPTSEYSMRVDILSKNKDVLYPPLSFPEYLLFIRTKVLEYADIDVDGELFARYGRKQLN